MNNKSVLSLLATLLAIFLLPSCGPSNGFTTASLLNSGSSSHDSNSAPQTVFKETDLMGNVQGGPTDQESAIVYDKSEHSIQIRIPMTGFLVSVDTEIPNVPGSRVYIDTTNFLVPELIVSVPARYVLGKMGFDPGDVGKDPSLLPNGQALPFTPGGEPPRISFLVPNINRTVQVYLGVNVFAVFAEVSFDPTVDLTFPIKNQSNTETIGYFSSVRHRAPFSGGFFVALAMPREIAGALDDYLRKVIVP